VPFVYPFKQFDNNHNTAAWDQSVKAILSNGIPTKLINTSMKNKMVYANSFA